MTASYFVERTDCPACNSHDLSTIYTCKYTDSPIYDYLKKFYSVYSLKWLDDPKYLEGADYILRECRNCRLIFQKNIPNDALMGLLYDCDVDSQQSIQRKKHKEQKNDFDYYVNISNEVEMLVKIFNKRPQELNFFEFGMGWAEWLLMAKAFGCNVSGSEIAQDQVRHAEILNIPNIDWLDIPAKKFDFIHTEQVFEHISQPLETLLHLRKSLNNGGIIKISVPNGVNVKKYLKVDDWIAGKKFKSPLNAVSPLEHINCFNYDSLVNMAKKAGFIEYKIPLAIQYRFTSNWKSARSIVKNIFKPFYINYIKKSTSLYFKMS